MQLLPVTAVPTTLGGRLYLRSNYLLILLLCTLLRTLCPKKIGRDGRAGTTNQTKGTAPGSPCQGCGTSGAGTAVENDRLGSF